MTLASSGAALPLILRLSLRFHMGTRASDAGRAEPAFKPVVLIKCTNLYKQHIHDILALN